MAVYTHIDESAMRGLLRGFAGIGELAGYSPILGGVTNSNFRVRASGGDAVLTIVEDGTSASDAAFYAEVMLAAAEAGVPAPRPYPFLSGGYVGQFHDKPVFLCAFLRGRAPTRPRNAHLYALGEALGAFHRGAKGIDADKKNAWGLARCKEFYASRRLDIARAFPFAEQTIGEELEYLEGQDVSFLPKGIVHGDLFPDNTLFEGEKLAGVLDFFYACRDTLLYDLAVCLNAWCFETDDFAFNFTKASFLLRGYHARRPLEDEEERFLPYFCRLAALRFLTSRLEAALRHSDNGALVAHHDPEEYCRRLVFHRRVKGSRPYASL